MYEVEVKVPANHDEVREALDDAGAAPQGVVAQADTYYNAPNRDFAETDEALRVRTVSEVSGDSRGRGLAAVLDAALGGPDASSGSPDASSTSRVTYKGPLVDDASKTREEFETGVDDGETMGAVFERLGFTPTATVRKVRDRYRVDGWLVVLDDVEDVGTYVEVETEVEDEDEISDARDEVYSVLRDLGLDPEEQIQASYLGIKLENA
ncbi:class IV adenylate cyclase [Halobacterium zhouii]|uniref:class IV adenylate cyclase n=1 Tax=Halobacterium zhouii TaxID=2902624 RepID=UPI001E64C1A6|nr:class IV adenylate cyclase [Halobacterium zhouii]